MKIKDLKKKSKPELTKLLGEEKEKVRDLQFKLASRQLKDVRALRKAKKDVARIKTLLNKI